MAAHLPPPAAVHAPSAEPAHFLRLRTVVQRTGLGRSTIYRLIAGHQFPQQVRLAGRAVGWRSTDVQQWAESRTNTGH